MNRGRFNFGILLLFAAFVLGAAKPPKDTDQIRGRRLAYTAVIMARQPSAMREFLAEDMVQLSSDGQSISAATLSYKAIPIPSSATRVL